MFKVPAAILVLLFALIFVIIVLGWINGSTAPLGGNGCVVMNVARSEVVTSQYSLNAKSVLSDSSYVLYSDKTDNFKNIGVWNLLKNLVINSGPYSINIGGKIFLNTDYESGRISYGKGESSQTTISNLKKGDVIGIFLQNNQCLKTLSGLALCDGQNMAIYNNSTIVKNYADSFPTLSGSLKVNGPQILDNLDANSLTLMSPSVKNFLSQSYDFLPILINEDGSLSFNLYKNSTSGATEDATGYYLFYTLKYSNSIQNNVASGPKGQVQFAFRNDDAPAGWVSNGVDNTPLDQVTILNSSSATLNASTEYAKVWVRILDDDYNDNLGDYLITVSQKPTNPDSFSVFINNIYQSYVNTLISTVSQSYGSLIYKVNFAGVGNINLIQLLSILYVTIYGIYFTLGLTRKSQEEFLGLIIKISLVNIMFSEQSWNFFNDYFFGVFIEGPFALINKIYNQSPNLAVASDVGNIAGQFSFIDETLGLFFSDEMLMVIIGFLSSAPIGWVISYVLIYMIFNYVLLLLDLIAQCFTSIITTSLMIAAFPIFVALTFFGATKDMTSKVVAVLAEIYIRVFILFSGLNFLQTMIMIFFAKLASFDICWRPLIKVGSYFTIYAYQPPFDPGNLMNIAVQNVLYFYVICEISRGFVTVAMDLSSNVANSYDMFFQANRSGSGGGSQMISGRVSQLAQTIGLKATAEDISKQKQTSLKSSINRHIDRNNRPGN